MYLNAGRTHMYFILSKCVYFNICVNLKKNIIILLLVVRKIYDEKYILFKSKIANGNSLKMCYIYKYNNSIILYVCKFVYMKKNKRKLNKICLYIYNAIMPSYPCSPQQWHRT